MPFLILLKPANAIPTGLIALFELSYPYVVNIEKLRAGVTNIVGIEREHLGGLDIHRE